ncbi:hypothetical protein MuYL_2841 [Mucilaginibacter xinganensis]|uniref:Uncharacterized protein n=1 Tax=Mucilaginibacter xinganensis TaxID=1234841 RepID=A0A223NYR9_9SPHI|nr:hypothetical protein MuYL_2841 [Mucilaginibacter xinganensis]
MGYYNWLRVEFTQLYRIKIIVLQKLLQPWFNYALSHFSAANITVFLAGFFT